MSPIPICSICCDKLTANCTVQSTKCGHLFHDNCIRRWLRSNTSCPECRQVSSFLHRVYLNFNEAEETENERQNRNGIETRTAAVYPSSTIHEETDEIENLILRLSLEEAKRETAEKLVQENKEKERRHAIVLRQKDAELKKLKSSLETERRCRLAAEEEKDMLRRDLCNVNQVNIQLSNSSCERRISARNTHICGHECMTHGHYHNHHTCRIPVNRPHSGLKNINFPDHTCYN